MAKGRKVHFVAQSGYGRCVFRLLELVCICNSAEQIMKPGTSSQIHARMGWTNNPWVKYLFLIFILFSGCSVEGVRRGSPWSGRWGAPQTQSVVGVRGPGVSSFGLALGVRSVFLFLFTWAKHFRRIPFSSARLTVWRSQLIFSFSSHWVNFFKPQEVCFLVFTGTESVSNFCRSSSSSWEDWECRFSSLFTMFSAMIWAWKWRHHFFHQRCRKTARTLLWLLDFDCLLISYDCWILTFNWFISAGGLKYILARKMRHNARQSDNNME